MVNSDRKGVIGYCPQFVILAVTGFSLLAGRAVAQTRDWIPVHPRPLAAAARLLQAEYRAPVTYEDPLWLWAGDSVVRGSDPDSPTARWLWDRKLNLPQETSRAEGGKLDAALVQRVIDAYHAQNPADARFKLIESSLGLHIVPAYAHDESGRMVAVTALLDTVISVPEAPRMPSEHLAAICQAVTDASGVKITSGQQSMDQAFAPNGVVPHRFAAQTLNAQEKEPYSFRWGATGMSARAAVVDLLRTSATTLTWALMCQPNLKRQNSDCVLNLTPIVIAVTGDDGKPDRKSISYDRCGDCAFLK
jgi:hypothetical protein